MKLLNLLSFVALATVSLAAAIWPKAVSDIVARRDRLCPSKCNVITSDCINKDLLGLDTCQQLMCQDHDCANCDAECKNVEPSSLMMASGLQRRDTAMEKQEAAPESVSNDESNLGDSMNPFMAPSCPKYCVGNRQACKEKGHSWAECNRQGCNGICLRMCEWCS